jgi:hypothetical protein
MNFTLLAQLLLLMSVAPVGDKPASCELSSKSVISRSTSGLAQVTNLGSIEITCRIAERPFPNKPGEVRYGLRIATSAYKIASDGKKELVPSEVNTFGGGFDHGVEWANFLVHIPVDSPERDTEARRYLAKLYESSPDLAKQMTKDARRKAFENIRDLVYQDRLGHFQVECRVMDGDRVMGVGTVELEVLFKGRFSDIGISAAPPA